MAILLNIMTEHSKEKKIPNLDFTNKWKFSESYKCVLRACIPEVVKWISVNTHGRLLFKYINVWDHRIHK